MLHKLNQHQYLEILDLVREMSIHLAVKSVLKGKSPGRVIANDPVKPTAACVITGSRCFLLGSAADSSFIIEVLNYLRTIVLQDGAGSGQVMFLLYLAPTKLQSEIASLGGELQITYRVRQYFTMKPNQILGDHPLPGRHSIRSITDSILRNHELINVDFLSDEIRSEAPTVEHFLENCFGLCVRFQDTLTGWCLSEYNLNLKCEVGIETLRPYQRRGIGSAMVSALVKEAENRGYKQIGWHSYKDNQASTATARKIGFVKSAEYPVCVIELSK